MSEPLLIKGYSRYLIAKEGYVLSAKTGRPMTPSIAHNGYMHVILKHDNGEKKHFRIHRLVAKYFVPPYGGEGLVVDHIDRDKTNNDFRNLRWVTHTENMANRSKMTLLTIHDCICICGHTVARIA